MSVVTFVERFAGDGSSAVVSEGAVVSGNDSLTSTVSGLAPSTTYCARPIAKNVDDTFAVGPIFTFTTNAASQPAPTLPNPNLQLDAIPTEDPPSPVVVTKLLVFDELGVARTVIDPKLRTIPFSVTVGKAKSKISVRVLYRKRLIGSAKKTGGPGRLRMTVSLNARGRSIVRHRKSLTVSLVVSVAPPGAKAITKQATVTLRRTAR